MIQFDSIEQFQEAVKSYLANNLTISVNTQSKTGDMGYGDYQEYKSHTIDVQLDGHDICSTTFDT